MNKWLVIALIVVIFMGIFLRLKIDGLQDKYDSLLLDYSNLKKMYLSDQESNETLINTLTESIEKYKINADNYYLIIKQKEAELEKKKQEIDDFISDSLSKDSSIDNQFKLVERMLNDFSK